MNMTETYREAVARQMPSVPASIIDALPIDYDTATGSSEPYLAQTGGWTMTIACGTRMLTEDADEFLVCDYVTDPDGAIVYNGPDFTAAWATLRG